MPSSLPLRLLAFSRRSCLALAGAAAACGPADARVETKLASDFAPARHAVSVLGVYKDGQMSADAWLTMSPKLSPPLGAGDCAAGYSETLQSANGPLISAIDDYARSNGPTDDLLAQLAPAARGDLIVVFTFAGKLPAPKPKTTVATNSGPPGVGQSQRGGGFGGGRRASNTRPLTPADPNELDISATIFSVAQKRAVGLVAMQYAGVSVDEAVAKFADQLAQALPQARCDGWDWTAKIDAEHLRQTIDQ